MYYMRGSGRIHLIHTSLPTQKATSCQRRVELVASRPPQVPKSITIRKITFSVAFHNLSYASKLAPASALAI